MFKAVIAYIVAQNKLVEPLYQMEKDGKLSGEPGKGMEGVAFLDGQLVKAGQMLGDIWLTAWLEAPEDTYLERQMEPTRPKYPAQMSIATATRIAAAAGFLAVALGAFGAHGLKDVLAQNGTAAIWETAVFYHFIHAVMLFLLAGRKPFAAVAWWCFLAGIVVFSGSLYLLAATNALWLGAVTPFGGASLLAGWGCLFFNAAKANEN